MPKIPSKESVDLHPYKSGLDAIISGIRAEIEVWYARGRDTEEDDDREDEDQEDEGQDARIGWRHKAERKRRKPQLSTPRRLPAVAAWPTDVWGS